MNLFDIYISTKSERKVNHYEGGLQMKRIKEILVLFMLIFCSLFQVAFADNTIFTAMDDPTAAKKPFEGSASAGYQGQNGNTTSSSLSAQTNMTWYQSSVAYSLWGGATNATSNDNRSSETYNIGGRSRFNLSSADYLFGQASWLSDRFNGYDARDVITAGYGRQILSGPEHSLRAEFGPGYRYDDFHGGGHDTQSLGYGALNYQWQISETTKLIQSLSLLSTFGEDTTINSETGLQAAINTQLALKLTYNVTWNNNPPQSAPERTDSKTALMLTYNM
jgi:putative salt-induced outer membrane protein